MMRDIERAANTSRTDTMNVINTAEKTSASLKRDNMKLAAELESLEARIKRLENELHKNK